MERPDVLTTGPLMPLIADGLTSRCNVHHLWQAEDRERFLAEVGGRIRGIAASGGHKPVDAALIDRLPKLEIVSNFGVGYDNVDARYAASRGVIVTNTPGVLDAEVADLAIGLLLATLRRLPQADAYLRAGKWLEKPFPLSPTLRGRTVGIVGMGRIGQAIAKRLEGFDVAIAYHSRRPAEGVAHRHYPDLLAMARDVDVLVVIVPGGPATKDLINAEVLDALGPNGVLINVARGSVVDEPALIEALKAGRILAAGLDVFAEEPKVPAELIALDNAVLLPHVGSASVHTRDLMGQLVLDNLLAWFDGKGPLTPVPETPWPRA